MKDWKAGMHDAKVQVQQLFTVRRYNSLDLIQVLVDLRMIWRRLVGVQSKRGFRTYPAERGDLGKSREGIFIFVINRTQVDQALLVFRGRADQV